MQSTWVLFVPSKPEFHRPRKQISEGVVGCSQYNEIQKITLDHKTVKQTVSVGIPTKWRQIEGKPQYAEFEEANKQNNTQPSI